MPRPTISALRLRLYTWNDIPILFPNMTWDDWCIFFDRDIPWYMYDELVHDDEINENDCEIL